MNFTANDQQDIRFKWTNIKRRSDNEDVDLSELTFQFIAAKNKRTSASKKVLDSQNHAGRFTIDNDEKSVSVLFKNDDIELSPHDKLYVVLYFIDCDGNRFPGEEIVVDIIAGIPYAGDPSNVTCLD